MCKYTKYRDQMQTGDVLLFSGTSPVSWLIRLVTKSKYSHVAMVYRDGDDLYCYESTSLNDGKNGVQISLLSNRLSNTKCSVDWRPCLLPRDDNFLETFKALRLEVKGRPYEKKKLELLKSAIDGTKKFWRNAKNLKSIFCSELVGEFFIRLGKLVGPSNEYTPDDFAKNMQFLGEAKRIWR